MEISPPEAKQTVDAAHMNMLAANVSPKDTVCPSVHVAPVVVKMFWMCPAEVFQATPWCFPHHNQVAFAPQPNQSMSTALWQERCRKVNLDKC